MKTEPTQPDDPTTARQPSDGWFAFAVTCANVLTVAACAIILITWAVTPAIRGSAISLLLMLVPLSVSVMLLVLPRGNRVRNTWCLLVFAIGPFAIAYLAMEAGARYAAIGSGQGDRSSGLFIWAADLVLWMYMLLNFVALMSERHARVEQRLAAADELLEKKQAAMVQKHDAYVDAQARDQDGRVVGLEKAVAALQKRISERDGY